MTSLFAVIAILATAAVFLTTTRGREVAKRIGLRNRVAGAATSEDLVFLLSRCAGGAAEVERRIEAERARFPDLTEADHVRRAIRKVLAEADREPESGSNPAER
jgi:hypothetical protein